MGKPADLRAVTQNAVANANLREHGAEPVSGNDHISEAHLARPDSGAGERVTIDYYVHAALSGTS